MQWRLKRVSTKSWPSTKMRRKRRMTQIMQSWKRKRFKLRRKISARSNKIATEGRKNFRRSRMRSLSTSARSMLIGSRARFNLLRKGRLESLNKTRGVFSAKFSICINEGQLKTIKPPSQKFVQVEYLVTRLCGQNISAIQIVNGTLWSDKTAESQRIPVRHL